jgi:nitrogen regulatory protein PII
MQRIGAILRESEAMAVRKAVCVTGDARVVITPIPYWICGVDTMDLYNEKRMKELDKQERLDVTADDSRSKRIVSAIQRVMHAGKVVLAPNQGSVSRESR